MNKAYQNMRAFWLDAKNMQSRKGAIEIGPEKIVAAAVEMTIPAGEQLKHLLIATNSLGDSSLYFENNSQSGLGGLIGGHGNEPLQEAAAHMLGLLAVSKDAVFYKEMPEEDARIPENPFYPMFAYSQQVLGLFKTQQQEPPSARA